MPQGKKTVSDEQIINWVDDHNDPIVAAAEVANQFEHSRQWAHARLQQLEDSGKIQKKEAGERSVVWWVE